MAFPQNASALSPTGSDNKRRLDRQEQQQQQQQQSEGAPPPFLTKTYDMIDDPATDLIVSWASKGASFVVWNPPEFARDLLPRYFKHNNFSSFVRQLNTYGFRKVDPDRWEFANEGFRRGQRQLLKSIHRRKPTHHHHHHHQPGPGHGCGTEITKVGLEGEVERLHRDKTVLMAELVRLRQVQQSTERELQVMGQRLHCTEQRQQHMISFMAKAIESPAILSNLMHDKTENSFLAAKRRRLELCDDEFDNQLVRYGIPPSTAESTRSRLIEFFSRPDLASKLEAEPLEDLVRELSSRREGVVEGREERDCPPRATLVEMQHSTLPVSLEGRLSIAPATAAAAAAPVVTDITNQQSSTVDVPRTPPLDLGLETCSASPSLAEAPGGGSGDATSSSGQMSETTRRLFRLVGVDSGAVGVGMNSGFWEQFLSPDSRQECSRASPSEEGRFLGNGIGIRIGSDLDTV